MDLRNKLFPYPILGEGYDDYRNSYLKDNVERETLGNKIILNINIETNNEEIKKLIEDDYCSYACHLECPATSYRKVIRSKENHIELKIEDKDICGKLQIAIFIVVEKSIDNYTNCDLNEDYDGVFFDFDKGNIIGIGGQYEIQIDKCNDELGKIPSIFSIIKRKEKEKHRDFYINLNNDKIQLLLSEEDYNNYRKIYDVNKFEPIIHSIIILPALIFVFEELSKGELDAFAEYRWFRGLKKSLARYKVVLNEELLRREDALKLAQMVLDLPVSRALGALCLDEDFEGDEY